MSDMVRRILSRERVIFTVLLALELFLLAFALMTLVPPARSHADYAFTWHPTEMIGVAAYAAARLLARRRGMTPLWLDVAFVALFVLFVALARGLSTCW